MEWKKHLGIIIIQCFWITYLCRIYFKCVFVLKIHSILCSSPVPWCHYLSTSELACTSSFGLWSAVNLSAFFSVVFWVLQNAPPCLPHPRDLQGHSLEGLPCAQWGPFLMQDGARAHNLSTLFCYLTTLGFIVIKKKKKEYTNNSENQWNQKLFLCKDQRNGQNVH